ncbi:hypothetical protein EDC04DRAFT_2706380 [Pisolithus marmoratus]|nr:hypothetical protein EDC04DRAFT_2706380 [Pisolithus marmoratus]
MNPEFDSEQDFYAQQLIQAAPRHGYPLWIPEPKEQLPPEYCNEGHRIGDVGVVTEDVLMVFQRTLSKSSYHPWIS